MRPTKSGIITGNFVTAVSFVCKNSGSIRTVMRRPTAWLRRKERTTAAAAVDTVRSTYTVPGT